MLTSLLSLHYFLHMFNVCFELGFFLFVCVQFARIRCLRIQSGRCDTISLANFCLPNNIFAIVTYHHSHSIRIFYHFQQSVKLSMQRNEQSMFERNSSGRDRLTDVLKPFGRCENLHFIWFVFFFRLFTRSFLNWRKKNGTHEICKGKPFGRARSISTWVEKKRAPENQIEIDAACSHRCTGFAIDLTASCLIYSLRNGRLTIWGKKQRILRAGLMHCVINTTQRIWGCRIAGEIKWI